MRAIKVTFRAVFEQPLGSLNPMGVKLPGPMPIELFESGKSWVARSISLNGRRGAIYEKLGRFFSLEHAKREVRDHFARQTQVWQVWGDAPLPDSPELAENRMLTPYEVADLGEGKFGWIQDEDRTHIIHAPTIPPGARIPPAACGAQVNAKCFISTKANIEPSCKECKEVWEKEYKGK